jgi:hypothetical protein
MARSETEKVFTRIYAKKGWGTSESASGPGSSVARTAVVRSRLTKLLKELGITSILDIPCGDFNWMRFTELSGIEYTGADIVAPLVEQNRLLYAGPGRTFLQIDMLCCPIPRSDLILCRDGLVHLSFFDIAQALCRMEQSGATYLLTTSFSALNRNKDIVTGDWRSLNLNLAPFYFPAPLETLSDARPDGTLADKLLALYRFADILESVRQLLGSVRKPSILQGLIKRSLRGLLALERKA